MHRAHDQELERQVDVSVDQVMADLGSRGRQDEFAPAPSHEDPGAIPSSLQPYFPAAFALSPEQPTHFNFELFLLDTLTLPRGLFAEDERGEVHFENAKRCAEYCERYVKERLESLEHSRDEEQTTEMRAAISKEDMFRRSGQAIDNMLTGNPAYDANLQNLRLDIYGNVMILDSPQWSDTSPQFTHGFPRRLIREGHRGLHPGNLIVAARISNQAIRSLSVGDVAGFISRKMVQGLGLTRSELVLARMSAIKYAGRMQKPSRLIDTMLRFGTDFLTMKPLTTQQIMDLRGTSTNHWARVLTAESPPRQRDLESDSSESSGEELEVAGWNIADECSDFMPGPAHESHSESVSMHVRHLLNCYVTASTSNREQVPVPSNQQPTRNRHGSGQRRRRRTTGPIMPVIPSVASQSTEGDMFTSTPRPDARAALLAMPGIVPARIPTDDSLARLAEFLRNNQPLASQVTEFSLTNGTVQF